MLIGMAVVISRSSSISTRAMFILIVKVGSGVVLGLLFALYSKGFLASDLYFLEVEVPREDPDLFLTTAPLINSVNSFLVAKIK